MDAVKKSSKSLAIFSVTLMRILDRDSLGDAITEVLVDARVHPLPKADTQAQTAWHEEHSRAGVDTI